MCTVAENFSTLIGSKQALDEVQRLWPSLHAVEVDRLELEIAPLERLDHSLDDPRAPRVGMIQHNYEYPAGATNRLQTELLLRGLPVVCEAGYYLTLAGGQGAGPVVTIDQHMVQHAATSALPVRAAGPRVAVLDTGYIGGPPTMVDIIHGQMLPNAISDDRNGHGTAVATLIRALQPSAAVYPIRVVDTNLATSYQMLCGLAYALWSEQFDIVNVSLSAQHVGGCPTVLGTSLEMILGLCQQKQSALPWRRGQHDHRSELWLPRQAARRHRGAGLGLGMSTCELQRQRPRQRDVGLCHRRDCGAALRTPDTAGWSSAGRLWDFIRGCRRHRQPHMTS